MKLSNSNIKIVVLGTNGWYPSDTGQTTCVFIDSPQAYIILDAGTGIQNVDKYIIDDKKPIYLFLSHFHLDHIFGMHILNKFNLKQGLKIYGQPGIKNILNKFVAQPFTLSFKGLAYDVDVYEVDEGEHSNLPFSLMVKKLVHSSKCFGYKFTFDNKIITFATDTGICDGIIELAQNADIFFTECALSIGEENLKWPHLNPKDAACLAKDSNVKFHYMLHFDAQKYPTLKSREDAFLEAKNYFKNSNICYDNIVIEI